MVQCLICCVLFELAQDPPDRQRSIGSNVDVEIDVSAEEFLKTHQASFTKRLQATTSLAQDACMMPGHNGQMSLIRTHEAMPGGVEIRFVNWTINGHRGRLVSLDASNKPIWTANSKCQELGLTDATVIYPAVGTRCRQVRK